MTPEWEAAQEVESAWWGDCTNTYHAETMQFLMATRMGLNVWDSHIRTAGTIADIGGGPVSMLLKSEGWERAIVVDPGVYPRWTRDRYGSAGIEVRQVMGEAFVHLAEVTPDEIWIYDTLQHVVDPEAIVAGACDLAPVVRLFEWIEFETNDAHIHTLIAADIESWATKAGSHVAAGGVTNVPFRGEDNLCFPAVFVR
jgi:hypothetical protein